MRHALRAAPLIGLLACSVPAAATGCGVSPVHAWLDFWLGDWTVCIGTDRAGANRVSRALDGCAVLEDWTGADGTRGMSLFYVALPQATWRQVWITDAALRPGGWKEKHLVARGADGGLRFQGEIVLADGTLILDRTTLRPNADRTVSQRIEISRDGGDAWTTTFDALYRHGLDTTCR